MIIHIFYGHNKGATWQLHILNDQEVPKVHEQLLRD